MFTVSEDSMNRRELLKDAAATYSLSAFPHHLFAGMQKNANDWIKLGPMGVELSRLAMGAGTNGVGGSSNQTRKMGLHGVADLFRAGYDNGLTFLDASDQNGTHPHLREALKTIKREKVTILSKGAIDVNSEAREDGIVRTHGSSNHSIEALECTAKTPFVHVKLARINPAGVAMEGDLQTGSFRPARDESRSEGHRWNEDFRRGKTTQQNGRMSEVRSFARKLRGATGEKNSCRECTRLETLEGVLQ